MKPDLTILIPCRNNRQYLEQCIPEYLQHAAQVLVVDSYSTDGSAKIAAQLGAEVVQRRYDTSARQKNWALTHVRTEWVFQIDTDEEPEAGLFQEICAVVQKHDEKTAAYRIPRKNHYQGAYFRYGGFYPDYQCRLFRRGACRWLEREVHAHLHVRGATGTLRKHILHYGMPSLSKQLSNLDRYTRYECDEMLKANKTHGFARLLFHPPLIFAYRYLWLRGFLDGWRGFVIAAYTAFYDFIAIVKNIERQHAQAVEQRSEGSCQD